MTHRTRNNYHRSLGPIVEVVHVENKLVRSIFTGPHAQERADQKARELDAQETQEAAQAEAESGPGSDR